MKYDDYEGEHFGESINVFDSEGEMLFEDLRPVYYYDAPEGHFGFYVNSNQIYEFSSECYVELSGICERPCTKDHKIHKGRGGIGYITRTTPLKRGR